MDTIEQMNFSEMRDAEIVARMRKCNYEKFKTLVRMHLSFELDLNTDEFDLPCHEIVYEDKGKIRKWNRLSRKHKHGAVVAALTSGSTGCAAAVGIKSSNNGNSNGGGTSPTESPNQQIDPGFLFHLQELKDFLMLEKNLQQEGIFRKTGSSSRQNDLRTQIQNDKPLDLIASGYSVHDCATVFKGYLAELSEPLLTDAHYPAHCQIAPLCLGINLQMDDSGNINSDKSISSMSGERLKKEFHVLNSIQLLLLLLPEENRQLLQHITQMLHAVASKQSVNKMGPDNLATLFAPHLICPRNLPPEALHYLARQMSSIISYMIIRAHDIFNVPAKLATDIRAYFLERKRKKTMSPEMTLDESISDISTVNTVYTFVDREKTAAAHNTNTTDTELAQLYAHIQSMPESSKKRRLIKQFNKQNGQATLFAPHLIYPRNLPPEALHYLARQMSSIISYMIIRAHDIFNVPAKLATDICAYFLERKRKKTMSKEMTLDESILDISTVNTVYTFVDREKTAAAHNTNTTDTGLAQLYAHIQSMPESSKKWRLIKQFNEQNGQGTPLQLQAMNRLKTTETARSSKSLSDSIKKHIFHKGIMSRTPKRQPIPATVLETPNNSNMKHHKQRVLFQSPNTQSIVSTSIMSSSTSTSSSAWSMANTTNSANHTPFIIKSHPLQKSISSSSLLMNQQQQYKHNMNANSEEQEYSSSSSCSNPSSSCVTNDISIKMLQSSNSSDGYAYKNKSISAPVSRQTSSDLQHHINTSITSTTSSLSSGISSNPLDPNCCVTPLKLISEAAKHLMVGAEKKSVAWDDSHLIDIERISNPSTPLQQTPNDLKSRYKSEPNLSLSHNICETPSSSTSLAHDMMTPISKLMPGKYITRKLMKGVSMGNLKFPFSTPESTKRLVRTVSSSLKRRSSEDSQIFQQVEGSFACGSRSDNAPLLQDMDDEDLDDDTFEDDPADDCGGAISNVGGGGGGGEGYMENETVLKYHHDTGSSSSELATFTGGSASYQQLLLQQSGIYRNLDLVTSTPSLLLGRRSMSPITKSTQRMPKAMQESIMTPRSRKPVMVLPTDQNQNINQTAEISENDEDEEVEDVDEEEEAESDSIMGAVSKFNKTEEAKVCPPHPEVINEDATSLGGYSDILKRQQLIQENKCIPVDQREANDDSISDDSSSNINSCKSKEHQGPDVLSANFKEYLLTRSVLTAPPEDASFTSHSDDFESSRDIDDMDENRLSSSLLYCLDGNRPECDENVGYNHAIGLEEDDDYEKEEEQTYNEYILDITNKKNDDNNVTTTASCSTHIPLGTNRLANNPFVILNNVRKRAATNDIEKISSILFNSQQQDSIYEEIKTAVKSGKHIKRSNVAKNSKTNSNKENDENYVVNKKLIISDYSGETSF